MTKFNSIYWIGKMFMNYCQWEKQDAGNVHYNGFIFKTVLFQTTFIFWSHTTWSYIPCITMEKWWAVCTLGCIFVSLCDVHISATPNPMYPGHPTLFGREMNQRFPVKLIFSVTGITFYKCWNFKAVLDENLSKTYNLLLY